MLIVHCHKSFGRSGGTSRPLSATSERKIQPDLAPETPTSSRRAAQPEEEAPARGEDTEVSLVWTPLEEEPKESASPSGPWLVRFGPSLDSVVSCRYGGNLVLAVVSHESYGRSDLTALLHSTISERKAWPCPLPAPRARALVGIITEEENYRPVESFTPTVKDRRGTIHCDKQISPAVTSDTRG